MREDLPAGSFFSCGNVRAILRTKIRTLDQFIPCWRTRSRYPRGLLTAFPMMECMAAQIARIMANAGSWRGMRRGYGRAGPASVGRAGRKKVRSRVSRRVENAFACNPAIFRRARILYKCAVNNVTHICRTTQCVHSLLLLVYIHVLLPQDSYTEYTHYLRLSNVTTPYKRIACVFPPEK